MFENLQRFFTRSRRARFFSRPDLIQLLLCGLFILLHLILLSTGKLSRVEYLFLDAFVRQRPPVEAHSGVQLIEIGEDSLQAIGRWPWPWVYFAQIVEILGEWGARAVAFDFVFPEPSNRDDEVALENALKKWDIVYLPVFFETRPEKKFWVHSLPIILDADPDRKGWRRNLPGIEAAAKGIGHLNADADMDGVFRRIRPFLGAGADVYPHLALKLAMDDRPSSSRPQETFSLPLGSDGAYFVNWPGSWSHGFSKVPFADVVRSSQAMKQGLPTIVEPSEFRDKICLIGLTAKAQGTFKVTAVDAAYPLLGILAATLENIRSGRHIIPVPLVWNVIGMALLGCLISVVFVSLRPVASFVIGLAASFAWLIGVYLLFRFTGIWIFALQPVLLVTCLFLFSTIYGHVVTGREKARLFDLATRDGLTGLFVIRYFREILNQTVEACRKSGEPLCVMLIDLDNFKGINDTYGHAAGDMVLKKAAQLIQGKLRQRRPFQEADCIGRYGGEEFIIMLRKTKLADAATKAAERVRSEIAGMDFEWEGKKLPVTISIGVSQLREGERVPDLMVRRADEALYQAKRTGKNRVCVELPAG
ncbi:MAG: diguanylate cyclase [Candidatus Omnitrophota bacterium]